MMNVRALSIILIALFALLQYKLWIAGDGISQTLSLRKSIANQIEKNNHLSKRNLLLAHQIHSLQTGQDSIEDLARDELGMVKNNEQYYQFITA